MKKIGVLGLSWRAVRSTGMPAGTARRGLMKIAEKLFCESLRACSICRLVLASTGAGMLAGSGLFASASRKLVSGSPIRGGLGMGALMGKIYSLPFIRWVQQSSMTGDFILYEFRMRVVEK